MTRTSSVAIVPRINGIRAIPPPGLSRSCMNVIIAGRETVVRRGQRTIWAAFVKGSWEVVGPLLYRPKYAGNVVIM